VAGPIRGKAKDRISFLASGDHAGAIFNGGINEKQNPFSQDVERGSGRRADLRNGADNQRPIG
jgi:hypothetical protein